MKSFSKRFLLTAAGMLFLSFNSFAGISCTKAARCTTTTTTTITNLRYNPNLNDCRDDGTNCTKTIVTTNPIAIFSNGGISGDGEPVAIKVTVAASLLEVTGLGTIPANLLGETTMTLGIMTFTTLNAGSYTVNVVNAPFDPLTRMLTIPLKY